MTTKGATAKSKPPFVQLDMAPPSVEMEERADGSLVLRSTLALEDYAPSLGHMLRIQAEKIPEALFLAERPAGWTPPAKGQEPAAGEDGAWRRMSYGQVLAAVRGLAQAFLDRGLGPGRPVMLLSDNAIDHALVQLAAMDAGIPAVPVSPAYSLMSQDHGKLKYIFGLIEPGLIYMADGARFAPALAALDLASEAAKGGGHGIALVASVNAEALAALDAVAAGGVSTGVSAESLDDLLATAPGAAADAAFATLGPDTVAKILFTSGSTGLPKGVINTQRMMCSSQQAARQLWRFLAARPPVLVDWMPWSHTFGGNFDFNCMLWNGGTMYIDNGKPAPGLIETTVANLREISPTLYLNVPRGFDMLIPYLREDAGLRGNFFRQLDLVFYAGAALPPNLWADLEELSIEARGARVAMLAAWGSTETSPLATLVHVIIERAGVIGLPTPGTELKLAPSGSKMEMRLKGPNITPGYWRRPDATAAAFDEEGYLKMGDAGLLADPGDPSKGLLFDGRTAENFKLTSGTWVHVGDLRLAAIAAGAPVIQDAVIAGHGRDDVGLLVFANPGACIALCPDLAGKSPAEVPLAELAARDEVRAALIRGLRNYNENNTGGSRRIARALILTEPASIDRGEITDKGYINQRAVLEHREHLVAELYAPGGAGEAASVAGEASGVIVFD